jgi:hypothetical protein
LLSSLAALTVLAALSVTTPSAAQSQAPRASLVVTRAEGAQDCPDAVALAEQVRAVAGSASSDLIAAGLAAGPSETWIQVAITRDFGGYRAQIGAFGRHHGARTLEDLGPGCASLADAIAVTLAIFLDPYANTPMPSPASSPPLPVRPPSATRKQRLARPGAWSPESFVDASGGAGFALLEHSQPLLGGSFGMRLDSRWSLAVGGTFVFPDTKATSAGNIALKLSYGSLLGCGRALGTGNGTRIDWCAGPLLGSLAGRGQSYRSNFSERALWLAIAAGPQVVFPFSSSLAWVLGAQGVVPLVRQGFDVQTLGVRSNAYRSAAVAGLVTLGIRGTL